jgi:serine/threonine protein kinase
MGEVRLRELLFRGEQDTDISQLCKIFHVLGTPTEDNWAGFSALPDYPRYKIPPKAPADLNRLLPSFRPDELELLQQILRLDPNARLTAAEALDHVYFRTEPRATPSSELVLPLRKE